MELLSKSNLTTKVPNTVLGMHIHAENTAVLPDIHKYSLPGCKYG